MHRLLIIPCTGINGPDGKRTVGDLTLHRFNSEYVFLFEFSPATEITIYFRLAELSVISLKDRTAYFVSDTSNQAFFLSVRNLAFFTHLIEFLIHAECISESGRNEWCVTAALPPGRAVEDHITALRKSSQKVYITPLFYTIYLEHLAHIASLSSTAIDSGPRVTVTECRKHIADGSFAALEAAVFRHGLDDDARPFLYPYLLGVRDPSLSDSENDAFFASQTAKYVTLRRQWQSFLPSQLSSVREVAELIRVVDNDVKRTDRHLPQFHDTDGPYCMLLNNVLVTYGVYNGNSNYVQGMGDLISPLIVLMIESWDADGCATLRTGVSLSRDAAEALMFWLLVGIMQGLGHGALFYNLYTNQQFILERMHTIARTFDPPFATWAKVTGNSSLIYMFRPYLLLFKRDLPVPALLRVWDSFLTAAPRAAFPRFFASAVLILLFPKFLTAPDDSLGEIVHITDTSIATIDPLAALKLACAMIADERIRSREELFRPFPDKADLEQSIPRFLRLN